MVCVRIWMEIALIHLKAMNTDAELSVQNLRAFYIAYAIINLFISSPFHRSRCKFLYKMKSFTSSFLSETVFPVADTLCAVEHF